MSLSAELQVWDFSIKFRQLLFAVNLNTKRGVSYEKYRQDNIYVDARDC